MARAKVLVAMSGGVDSSVAAALLLRQGYDVVGCFMRLGSPGETLDTPACDEGSPAQRETTDRAQHSHVKIGHQGCCSINDAADARLVAARLGVPFYVVNFKKDFGRIMDYFADAYARGETPNPCVRCNDWLKFGKLHDYALQLGADFVASGHYARVEPGPHGPRLMRGLDETKDQSYVLFGVGREQLSRMLLPIGTMRKSDVRALAQELGLPTFDKPDSQEICFVPHNEYAQIVEARSPHAAAAHEAGGRVLDPSGNVVGSHAGQHRFTIGQRRGVGVALGYPIYVIEKDPHANTITVGPAEMLLTHACTVGEANWLSPPLPPGEWRRCWAKYRYNTPAARARVRLLTDSPPSSPTPSGRFGRFEVRFDEPQSAVSPGQALVIYDAEEPALVLGGGWIHAVEKAAEGSSVARE